MNISCIICLFVLFQAAQAWRFRFAGLVRPKIFARRPHPISLPKFKSPAVVSPSGGRAGKIPGVVGIGLEGVKLSVDIVDLIHLLKLPSGDNSYPVLSYPKHQGQTDKPRDVQQHEQSHQREGEAVLVKSDVKQRYDRPFQLPPAYRRPSRRKDRDSSGACGVWATNVITSLGCSVLIVKLVL